MECIFIFGTRPEAIKLAPLIREFTFTGLIKPVIVVTGQHRGMLDQVLKFFDITPDVDLDLMRHNQSICDLTSRSISGLNTTLQSHKPDMVIVQGDTTTAMCGAYCAAMNRIPVSHIEAGLRSGRRDQPFPEEFNRQLIGNLADIHFCATPLARNNLLAEGKNSGIHVVGNTVIDALFTGLKIINENWKPDFSTLDSLNKNSKIVLITLHRRESFGEPLHGILDALCKLSAHYPLIQFVLPVHPNPNVSAPIQKALGLLPNFHLLEPLDYPHFIWLMSKSTAILTDSGGIQEEAPSLGIPLVVARNVTERPEGIKAGVAILAGTQHDNLLITMENILKDPKRHNLPNPYGDGNASKRIHNTICKFLGINTTMSDVSLEFQPDLNVNMAI